ncbi:Arc family DNA-binding protein [Acinetobacter sp. ANC 4277]|uniref:Arc family DNA-binding protein n=1 Tax=Acinetobacter terrae TaxID=2731247 RepID=UPI00148F9311|nr:Arc family DNA-binding protein [Acinetobacter terrae]NNG75673.1 Arc family DNA-binding protein [Acinetobacter terrae]
MSNKHLNAQYNLRWPDDLKEKVAQSAKEYNRSMNADIVARLESSFISTRVASDPYKRMLLAVIANIVAEQADSEKPSFQDAIDKITKAIMVDEDWFNKVNGQLKKPTQKINND